MAQEPKAGPAISIGTLASIRSHHPRRLPWNGTIWALGLFPVGPIFDGVEILPSGQGQLSLEMFENVTSAVTEKKHVQKCTKTLEYMFYL